MSESKGDFSKGSILKTIIRLGLPITLAELVPVDGLALPPCNGVALILWFGGMLFVSEYFLPNRTKPAWLGWGLMMAAALVWFLV